MTPTRLNFLFFVFIVSPWCKTIAQGPELILPAANSNQLQAVAISSQEKFIASADLDGKIKIWENATGKLIKTLVRDDIYELAFTMDEKKLVITTFEPAEVYTIETGESVILPGQKYVEGLAISADGKWIATGGESRIMIWDAGTLKLKDSIISKNNNSELKFSPDSKTLALFGGETIEAWSVDTRKLIALTKHDSRVIKVEFSKDNLQLLSASDDQTAKLWDIRAAKLVQTYAGHTSTVWDAKFHPDNKSIITVSSDNTGKIWDKKTGELLSTLKGHPDWVYNVAVSPDGKTFAMSDSKGYCSVWDATTNKFLYFFRSGNETLYFLKYFNSGNQILTGNYDPVISRWNINTQKKELEYGLHNDRLTSISVSHDEKSLLVTSRDGIVRKIDPASGKIMFYKKLYANDWATSAEFSPDDSRIIVAGGNGSTFLMNIAGAEEDTLNDYSRSYESFSSFSPDGKYVLHNDNSSVQLIRVADNKRLLTENEISMFTPQRFSPDGVYLITGGKGKVKIWSVLSQSLVSVVNVSTEFPANIEMSNDSRYFLSVNNDQELVEIFETATGNKLDSVQGINYAGFLPGGSKLVLVYMDGRYCIKDLNTGKETLVATLENFHRNVEYHFLSDRKVLLVKSASNITIHDLQTGKQLKKLIGSEITYTPKGNLLYLINDDLMEIYNMRNWSMVYRHFTIGENDYLVQDKQGRYDGTEAARKTLYFVCGTEVIELEQAKDQLWVPELAERLSKGDVINAKSIDELNICNLSPEMITRTESGANYSFTIKPRRGGLGETVVYVNGIEAKRLKASEMTRLGTSYQLTIKKSELSNFFIAGKENLVMVKSYTSDNSVSSRGLIVKEDRSAQSSQPPNLYAVMIGVSDYKGNELDLKYAAKDATDISAAVSNAARKLLNTDGREHVFMYNLTTDKDHYQFPEKLSIKKVLSDIGLKATPNDILMIFFAGHGVMSGTQDKKQFYFLTADASTLSTTGAVKDVGISTSELVEWMKPQNIKAQKRILIFDACNSGQAINDIAGKDLAVRNDDKAQQIKAIDKLNEKSGLFILSASASDQSAYEMGRYSQGLLTYSLLKAIKQQPDILEDNKYLNVSRWFSAAERSVSEISKENGARQEPQIVTNTNFNIGIVDDSVIAAIKLPAEKPLFAASNFQNSNESIADDDLELSRLVNIQLSDLERRGGDNGIVYVTATNAPEAWTLSGRYAVNENAVTMTVNLKQNKTIKKKFEVNGTRDSLDKLAKLVAEKAAELVK